MQPIQLKHSTDAGHAPPSLLVGEIAINETDGKLYYRNSAGNVVWLPLVSLGAPGDIILTFDAAAPSYCVELDGATITGGVADYPRIAARYAWMVSGANLILPDARGRFMRVWAHGSANDPDRASRTARVGDGQTGDYPATYQADELKSHTHALNQPGAQAAGYSGTYAPGDSSGTWTPTIAATGGNETRGINLNVSAWMRMG